MRILLNTLLLLLACGQLPAQKVLQIEKYGKPEVKKIFIGAPLSYQLRGEDIFHSGYIMDIKVEDSLLVLDDRYVNVYDISALQYERSWPRLAGLSLFIFGVSWSGFAAIGTAIDGDDDTYYRWSDAIVSAGSIGLSLALPALFKKKTIRMGKRRQLRLLDLRFTKEAWED